MFKLIFEKELFLGYGKMIYLALTFLMLLYMGMFLSGRNMPFLGALVLLLIYAIAVSADREMTIVGAFVLALFLCFVWFFTRFFLSFGESHVIPNSDSEQKRMWREKTQLSLGINRSKIKDHAECLQIQFNTSITDLIDYNFYRLPSIC